MSLLSRVKRIEQEALPAPHRHNPNIILKPGDDPEERLLEAQAECAAVGCMYGHLLLPEWRPAEDYAPGEWIEMVKQQYGGMP